MIETFPSNVSHTSLIKRCFLCIRNHSRYMKKVFEKIIEGMLTCSGFVTSITILLIVLFLFIEAFGLFKSKVIEEGYVLALNKSNKISVLSPAQIKNVFDEEITNWKELGGEDLPIRVFRLEDITRYYTEFFYMGEMVEFDQTKKIFTNPEKEATQNYITGRFG